MGIVYQNMDPSSAIQQYGLLTIGDGLVSQIPSLLISLATGILVTKGSKDADFGSALIGQLFGIPRALYIVGITICILGLVTPLQDIIFVGLGVIFIISGRVVQGTIETARIENEVDAEEEVAE